MTTGMRWFDAVDSILNVPVYKENYFEITQRWMEAAHNARNRPKEEIPRLWLQRVEQWAQNLRNDLRDDGVWKPGADCEADGNVREKWMLYIPATTAALDGQATSGQDPKGRPSSQSGAPPMSCTLCASCSAALGSAVPHMPWKARARGMWRGPQPQCLAESNLVVV